MPRRLLRDGLAVVDDWMYLPEAGEAGPVDAVETAIILPLDAWLGARDRWQAFRGRLGIVIEPADPVEMIAEDVQRFELICARFTGPSEGRGYTQGRLLRERFGFSKELRAGGYVRLDQLFIMARCGFNAFELPETELAAAPALFNTFTARYQPTNDRGLARALDQR